MSSLLQNVFILFVWNILNVNASSCPGTNNVSVIQMCQDGSVEGTSLYIDSSQKDSTSEPCQCLLQTADHTVKLTVTASVVPKDCHSRIEVGPLNITVSCNEETPDPTTHLVYPGPPVSFTMSSTNHTTWGNFCIGLDVESTNGDVNVSVICKGQKGEHDGKVSYIVLGVFAAIILVLILLGVCLYLRDRLRVKRKVERLRKSKIKSGYDNKGMVMTHL